MSTIRRATPRDHKAILAIAKRWKVLSAFGHQMFSGPAAYDKGWVRVFEDGGTIVGFTCVRHKVRDPETSLYFIGVDPDCQRTGIGFLLLRDLKEQSPHRRIVLSVTKDNESAIPFYEKHGFVRLGESLKGKGWKMALEW